MKMRTGAFPAVVCGYGADMSHITIPRLVIRTTSDGAGHVWGVVAETGLTAREALASLGRSARARADEIAAAVHQPEDAQPDVTWSFEVIDVRMVAGPADGEAWLAVGTLTSDGAHPWDNSYWRDK